MAERTITMTGRRPVIIEEGAWPEVAAGTERHDCGQHGQNGRAAWTVRIRARADGQRIVYGVTDGGCQCGTGESPTPRAGELVAAEADDGALREVVHRVACAILVRRDGFADEDESADAVQSVTAQVMAGLPAERL